MKTGLKITLLVIVSGLFIYLARPVLNWGYLSLPLGILGIALLYISLSFAKSKTITTGKKVAGAAILLVILYILGVGIFGTWSLFHAEEYRNLLGEVAIGENFSESVAPIETSRIRLVDEATAHRLGDKVLGERPSLGSQTKLGDFNIQKVGDQLYWVAPLLHSGFFKWAANPEGTPAYVMVSATNERDVKLVQEYGGQPIKIKYQPNGFFGTYLPRHLYFNGYLSRGLTDYTFEVDDTGKPYWVVTYFSKEIGFSGKQPQGVVVVDAATGQMQSYPPTEAPAWVDRVQPEDIIDDQLDWWGEYVHGFWNFSNKDKLQTTKGMSLVYGKNNRSYWYTGITSVGNDEGTVGFVLVDTRNKETTWFRQTGATETAAMQSAAGKVQEKGYEPSFPITYNINGVPTYVMALKDQAGLIKMAAMVSVQDYSLVGVGSTLQEALRSYRGTINNLGNALAPSSSRTYLKLQSSISRLGQETLNGNTYYYLLLEGEEDRLFVATTGLSAALPITQAGDIVEVQYDDTVSQVVDLLKFENLSLELRLSKQQRQKLKEFQEIELPKIPDSVGE
jgi:hypothetical protein